MWRRHALTAVALTWASAGCAPDPAKDLDQPAGDSAQEDTAREDTAREDTAREDTAPDHEARAWYVDCDAGSDDADGLSPETAWGSLSPVNALALGPGDAISFARGATCEGALTPQGAGTPDAPITIGSYGQGDRPVLNGEGHEATLTLQDISGIEVADLELTGSGPYGVLAWSTAGTMSHVRLRDLEVHDVNAGPIASKTTGLVVFTVSGEGRFEDVVIDGVDAHHTDQWAGILVYGAEYDGDTERSADVRIRNSSAHHVYGDGIVLFMARDSVIETSVAYQTGLQPVETIGTPNAIWTWMCERCTVQYNEGYESFSPGVDGGVFDIDWGNVDNVVQYNYGHDAQGYCVAVFGAESRTTSGSVVRYNVCANNGRGAPWYGEVFLYTWSGGRLDGVSIHNNSLWFNPGDDMAALVDVAEYAPGGDNHFVNNLVVARDTMWVLDTTGELTLDHNLYWLPDSEEAYFSTNDGTWGGYTGWHDGLPQWRRASGQDSRSLSADPLLSGDGGSSADDLLLTAGSPAIDAGVTLPESGGCDFWGRELGATRADIGAHEYGASPGASCGPSMAISAPAPSSAEALCALARGPQRRQLVSTLNLAERDAESPGARSQAVVLRSAASQAPGLGVVLADTSTLSPAQRRQRARDWGLPRAAIVEASGPAPAATALCVDGAPTCHVEGYAAAAAVASCLGRAPTP